MVTIAERMREAMTARRMSQADLVRITKIGKSSISTYLSGEYELKQKNIFKIAAALQVSEAWLMGYDVPMQRSQQPAPLPASEMSRLGLLPLKTQRLPLHGETSCIDVSTSIQADFCLCAKGDSMVNARILDGDIVFIRKQSSVENGKIAAVVIGDEAMLKRVFFRPDEKTLILQAENPAYPPLIFVGDELKNVVILGIAVAFQSDVE